MGGDEVFGLFFIVNGGSVGHELEDSGEADVGSEDGGKEEDAEYLVEGDVEG